MLARKPISWSERKYVATKPQTKKKEPPFIADMAPGLRMCLPLVVVVFVCSLAYLGIIKIADDEAFQVVDLQNKVAESHKLNDELYLQVAELKSPTRIQKIAQEQLGMVLPDSFIYRRGGTVEKKEAPGRIVD